MYWWVLKRKIHASWLITICCAAILAGVFGALFFNFDDLWLVPVVLLIGFSLWHNRVYAIPLLVIGGILLGLCRGSISQNELSQYRPLLNKTVSVVGVVADDIDTDPSGQIKIRLDGVAVNGKQMSGMLWATSSNANIKRGDRITLDGKLSAGFGSFVGTIYRANITKIVHPDPEDFALAARDWFSAAIRRVLPEPQASLGIGYLVGQRRSLPTDLVTALQIVGLTHVVVASGYNLTILVRLARRLFEKISKYLSALSSVVMIFAFLSITGLSPSMSRAALVSCMSLAAWYYGRRFHPIVLLLLAMAVTVLINPSYLWGDLGWQLSFAAFAGVMILAPLLQRYFLGDRKPGFVAQILFETVSAQIATAPIIIAAFGMFSNVALLANLLVLPLVPFAMLLTFIAGMGSMIIPAATTIISAPANWLLSYMTGVIDFFSRLPWAASSVQLTSAGLGFCYLAIIGLCIFLWRVTRYNLREVNLVE